MNRSALVIKMLNILYGRSLPISREELAEKLETNLRNISEFKRELEVAGYVIESVRGKYGGYLLREESVFPSIKLEEKEKTAINEVLSYLQSQSNFIFYDDFEHAMEKVKAKIKNRALSNDTIYMNSSRKRLDEYENEMLNKIMEAKEQCLLLNFDYQSNESKSFESRCVRPYEVIVNNEGFYVLAEDITKGKKVIYKFFKIIKERMLNVQIESKQFLRDSSFRMSDYIGKHALMRDMHEVSIEVRGLQARLINEQEVENTLTKRFEEDVLYLHFMMEGKIRLKHFILSLGASCKVISPPSLKEEIQEELTKALAVYQK